jgi:hypothetical protein
MSSEQILAAYREQEDALNWMIAHGLISQEEYYNILDKFWYMLTGGK